jgi:hypothetical protein
MEVEGFSIEVIWHDEDVLQLLVRVGNEDFAGTAKVYAGHDELREIATAIAGFPSGRGDTRRFTLGAFGNEYAGGGVSIDLRCETNAGHSFADVRLESDPNEGAISSVALCFPFEAGAIDSFVVDLRHLNDQRSGVAKLSARGNGG